MGGDHRAAGLSADNAPCPSCGERQSWRNDAIGRRCVACGYVMRAIELDSALDSASAYSLAKAPWHLLPWDAINEIVKVLRHGARKHGDRDWERGYPVSKHMAAMCRHFVAWWLGQDNDPGSGLSHMAHAGCRVLFILTAIVRKRVDLDDRPKVAR